MAKAKTTAFFVRTAVMNQQSGRDNALHVMNGILLQKNQLPE